MDHVRAYMNTFGIGKVSVIEGQTDVDALVVLGIIEDQVQMIVVQIGSAKELLYELNRRPGADDRRTDRQREGTAL